MTNLPGSQGSGGAVTSSSGNKLRTGTDGPPSGCVTRRARAINMMLSAQPPSRQVRCWASRRRATMTSSDPIFAAIEAHRSAHAAFVAADRQYNDRPRVVRHTRSAGGAGAGRAASSVIERNALAASELCGTATRQIAYLGLSDRLVTLCISPDGERDQESRSALGGWLVSTKPEQRGNKRPPTTGLADAHARTG
jgi:hypothetical protein